MSCSKRWVPRVSLAAAGIALLTATSAMAQVRSGQSSESKGNSLAKATRVDSVLVSYASTGADSYIRKRLQGTLLRSTKTFADVALESHSNGGSLGRVVIGGKTLFTRSVSSSTSASLPQTMHPVYTLKPKTIVDLDPAIRIELSAQAGAGSQFSNSWGVGRSPIRATINGAAQTWGYGEGTVGFRVLAGLADGKLSTQLNFFNSTVRGDLRGVSGGVGASSASYEAILWRLFIKVKGKILGFIPWSKTLVDRSGPTTSGRLI